MAHRKHYLLYLLIGLLVPLVLVADLFAQVSASDMLQGLVACWDMNESDGVRYDYSITGNYALTDNNTVGTAAGHVHPLAASFVPSNAEFLSHLDDAGLRIQTDFTIAGWASPDVLDSSNYVIVSKGTGSPGYEYHVRVRNTSNKIYYSVATNSGVAQINSTELITATEYLFFSAWRDDAAGRIYLSVNNGTTQSAVHTDVFTGTYSSLFFGKRYAAFDFFDGRIGPIYLWDRVLLDSERDWLWNDGEGRSCSDITGVTDALYASEAIDLPSGRTGTLQLTATAGEAGIITLLSLMVLLVVYWIISKKVLEGRASAK